MFLYICILYVYLYKNIYSYDNYYNWYSATAGNGLYNTGADVTVIGDICPNGWHLPYSGVDENSKGNTSGGFSYLDRKEGGAGQGRNYSFEASNRWRSFPNNFIYSYSGNDGYYWSSTGAYYYQAYPTASTYSLDVDYDYAHLAPGHNSSNKTSSYSVRCLINS